MHNTNEAEFPDLIHRENRGENKCSTKELISIMVVAVPKVIRTWKRDI